MKLNLEDVLFMCLGTTDATLSLADLSEMETFLDPTEAVEGVDLGNEEDASTDTELADERILLSSFGGTGGIGCSGSGFCRNLSRRA